MQINSKKLKRDCFIAVAIPICLFAVFQLYSKSLPAFGLLVLTTSGAMIISWYLYRFFAGLEDMTWREQLSSVLKRVSTPVLITDLDHNITYTNESFSRLPLANLASSYTHFPELLASLDTQSDPVEKCKQVKQFKETFDVLSGKLKAHTHFNGAAYEWIMVPLYTPTNNRWGTVIECVPKGQQERDELAQRQAIMIENPTINKGLEQTNQARIIIDTQGNILNANTAMLNLFLATDALEKSNAWQAKNFFDLIEEIVPDVIQPMQNALNSQKLTTFICEFNDKVYDWTIQPIFEDNEWCGNLIEVEYPSKQEYKMFEEAWQRSSDHKDTHDRAHLKELSQMLIDQSGKIQTEIANLVIEREQAANPLSAEAIQNAINSAQVALAKTMNYAETVTLISQQLHENQTYIQQLQKLMEKFNTLPTEVAHGHFNKISKEVIESLSGVKQVLSLGKQRLTELLVNFDDLRQSWLGAMSELRNGTIDVNAKQIHLVHARASEKIVSKLQDLVTVAHKIMEETEQPHHVVAISTINGHQPFDQVLIDRDAKKHSEAVLLEDVNGNARQ